MADLTHKESAQNVKVVGSNTSGVETNYVKVSDNQDVHTSDVIATSGVYSNLSVSTTAVEVKVGGAALANRKVVTILPEDGGPVYFGFSNAVTASTGTPVYKRQLLTMRVTDDVSVWLIAAAGTIDVRITEGA